MKKANRWLIVFYGIFLLVLVLVIGIVIYIDPYLHYHAPQTDRFYYDLNSANERDINDGLAKHTTFNGVIVGTSMTENFQASTAEELFGGVCAKLPYSGGTLRETCILLETALESQPDLRWAIRSLDMNILLKCPGTLRSDLGGFPPYLYSLNPFNDVYYLLNRDVVYKQCYTMLRNSAQGITDYDSYAYWNDWYTFGSESVLQDRTSFELASEQRGLTEEERDILRENISTNVLSLAEKYPQVEFYYFFTPYSAAWWGSLLESGIFPRQLEALKLTAEMILPYKNVHLFSWNNVAELTMDLNNYKDPGHYASWVNDWMLRQMAAGSGRLTEENLEDHFQETKELYERFDYDSLFDQPPLRKGEIPDFFRN